MSNKILVYESSLFELTPKDPLLEFHPNTVSDVRKLYNFGNENDLNEAIDILDKWVKEQPHFKKKNFPRKYLEITLISLKGSLERAKHQMDKLCTLKTVLPRFYDVSDFITKFNCFNGKFQQVLLPKLTEQHHRVYANRILCNGLNPDFYFKVFQYAAVLCEYLKLHDYCDGFVVVSDFRDINIISFLSEFSMSDLHKIVTLIMKGYQMRLKGIHLVTESKTVDLIVTLFRQLFSKKIAERIFTHMSFDTVYNFVPREILPVEFGGEEVSMDILQNNMIQVLGNEENVRNLIEMRGATVIESMRPKALEEYEMIGTFRSLNVD